MDMEDGPRIVYQVPENLITAPKTYPITPSNTSPVTASADPTPRHSIEASLESNQSNNNNNNTALAQSRTLEKKTVFPQSPMSSVDEESPPGKLFEFELVSQFVVPRPEMCGRLTICTTRKHRIVGFPVLLKSDYYFRKMFQFNLGFVFHRDMDVSCYEPVVRKVARVLTTCEKEYGFLSSETTNYKIYPLLEQLFTDLNSFSETSIQLDGFNSIELKIFPHYPNPPPVNAWDVPVPLIDIANRAEANWDVTMKKIVPYINGIDHVKKIAHKANADLGLVTECMSQVLMYQCVMMTDIFQFSNIYTLCRPVTWLFADPAVYEECGPYVHKSGEPYSWPRLAWLYARLKPPLTVGKWIVQYNVDIDHIDVRRFISFGVIKGFLRRVHRWPILLKEGNVKPKITINRRRGKSISVGQGSGSRKSLGLEGEHLSNLRGSLQSEAPPLLASALEDTPGDLTLRAQVGSDIVLSTSQLARPARAWPDSLEDEQMTLPVAYASDMASRAKPEKRLRPGDIEVPPELSKLLDGIHHTDELCVHFQWSWDILQQVLAVIGGGSGEEGDLGRVTILYR